MGAAELVADVRDSGRFGAAWLGTIDAREGLLAVGFGTGRVVVDVFLPSFASSPCFAAEAAVGATRREGRPTGRVGDFGRGFLKPVGEVLKQH